MGAVFRFLFYHSSLVGGLVTCLVRVLVGNGLVSGFIRGLMMLFFLLRVMLLTASLMFLAGILVFGGVFVFFRFDHFACFAFSGGLSRLALRGFSRANCNEHEKD